MISKSEKRARTNPICQEYRELSIKLSYALRHKLAKGFTYYRDPNNSYGIVLRKRRITYSIWFFHNGLRTSICIDRRSRKPRGITTDPDLKIIATVSTVEEIIEKLREQKVITI